MPALTEQERAKVREYMGYSSLRSNLDPTIFGASIPYGLSDNVAILERNTRNILDDDTYALVQELLSKIENSRSRIDQAASYLPVTRVEGAIQMNKNMMRDLWMYDKSLCDQLGTKLAVAVHWHPIQSYGTGSVRVIGG